MRLIALLPLPWPLLGWMCSAYHGGWHPATLDFNRTVQHGRQLLESAAAFGECTFHLPLVLGRSSLQEFVTYLTNQLGPLRRGPHQSTELTIQTPSSLLLLEFMKGRYLIYLKAVSLSASSRHPALRGILFLDRIVIGERRSAGGSATSQRMNAAIAPKSFTNGRC